MANQTSAFQTRKAFLRTILIAVILGIVLRNLDAPEAKLAHFATKAATEAVAQLPSIIVTAWQALRPNPLPDQQSSLCAFQFLVFWPLIHTVVRVA